MLTSIARFAFRRRRLVVGLWILAPWPPSPSDRARRPTPTAAASHTDSQAAYDSLAHDFPNSTATRPGSSSPTSTPAADRRVPRAGCARRGCSAGAADGLDGQAGRDRAVTTTTVRTLIRRIAQRIQGLAAPLAMRASSAVLGRLVRVSSMPASEIVGVVAAIIVLLVAFGSLIAMGLPILTALVGIGISLAGVGIIANIFTTPGFARRWRR